MLIEMRPIDSIRPYPGNPRANDSAVDAVVASIKEFGWRQPILVDTDSVIVVGHTRHKAGKKMGLTEVPVHVAKDLTPAQARAYRLADNQTAAIAEWDRQLLPVELTELQADGFDLALLGFDPEELTAWMSGDVNDGLVDPDEVPAPPDKPITQPGDLWLLGEHRLLCGDSGNPEHVDRLLGGVPVHLVNTDPPYNVNVEPRSNNAIAAGLSSFEATPAGKRKPAGKMRAKDRPLTNDFVSDTQFDALLNAWFGNIARVLQPGRAFYVWGGYSNCGNYLPVLKRHGLYFSQAIIWDKQHPVLTRKDFMGAHEWAFYGWREGAAHKFFGPANVPDLWPIKKVNPQNMTHLTEKPVELAVRAVQYSSLKGENVLDLFGGSGSTLIAAEQTGRRAYLMELDPPYADVIVQRWTQFTGKKAERVTENTPASAGVSSGKGRK